MCIGPEDGCQDVPDPIAPIDMMLVALDPTRMPISFPDMTISGPIFIELIPGIPSMLFIPPIAPGEGLAVGIGMSIFIPGMFIPCMFPMSCFFAVRLFRVVFLFFRDVVFDLDFAFGLLIPGILDISCCARTGKVATNGKIAKTNDQIFMPKRKFIAL